MLDILSRIIVKTWIQIFFLSVTTLYLIIAFGDIVNNILRNKYTYVEIFQNLLFSTSDFFSKILPVSCLLATLFALNKLKNHSELIAILATGFSKNKITRLVIVLGSLVFLLQFINVGFLSPILSKMKQNQINNSVVFGKTNDDNSKQSVWFKGSDYFGSFMYYDKTTAQITSPSIYLHRDSHLEKIITADIAQYLSNGSWLFKNTKVYFKLSQKKLYPEKRTYDEYKVNLEKEAKDFSQYQAGILTLNFQALYSFITQLRKTGLNVNEYLVMFYDKIAVCLSCLIFALFPLRGLENINKRSASMGKSILFALVFSISFWLAASTIQSFSGGAFFSPFFATFILHFALLLYLGKLYFSLEKLS